MYVMFNDTLSKQYDRCNEQWQQEKLRKFYNIICHRKCFCKMMFTPMFQSDYECNGAPKTA